MLHQLEIKLVVLSDILRKIHQLHRKIDAFGRGIGRGGGEDVLFAQDRQVALDEQARALVAVADHGSADDDPLVGLQFDLEGHAVSSLLARRGRVRRSSF